MVMVVSVKRDSVKDGEKFQLPPVGMFVKAEVPGKPMGKVFSIPREALRDGGAVWVLAENEVLEIVAVEVIRSERDEVIIKAEGERKLTSGDRIIISPIAIPASGMKLELEQSLENQSGGNLK